MNIVASPYADQKRANRALSIEEYANGCVELESRPRALFIELTQGCNLTCPMCRSELIPPSARRMSDALFDRIAETLLPTAELVDLRGWGESLILPEAMARIETVRLYGAAIRVVTNLSFRRDKVLDALVDADAIIDVSLDSASPNILEKVRRGAQLHLITDNIRYILDRFGHARNLTMLVTVQRATIATLPGLVDYAADLGVRQMRLFSVTADNDSEMSLEQSRDLLDHSLAGAAAIARARGIKLTAGTRLGSLPENATGFPVCIHPWAYCYVAYNGDVSFCDHLIGPGNAEYVVGNLQSSDFNSIWNGFGLRRIRSEHLGKRRADAAQFSHCAWCYKSKYIDFEQLFDANLQKHVVQLA
jgi:radical SAM protein with 4Fe4S-binding SPASM domain